MAERGELLGGDEIGTERIEQLDDGRAGLVERGEQLDNEGTDDACSGQGFKGSSPGDGRTVMVERGEQLDGEVTDGSCGGQGTDGTDGVERGEQLDDEVTDGSCNGQGTGESD